MFSVLTRCKSCARLENPPQSSLAVAAKAAAPAAGPGRASYRQAAATYPATHPGPSSPSRLESSGRSSPEDLDKVRQRLIASGGYQKMIDRVEGKSPFVDTEKSRGVEEGAEEPPVVPFLRTAVRAAVDVAIVLVPVGLVVVSGKVPAPVLEALTSAVTAIKASPLEPVRVRCGGGDGARRRLVFFLLRTEYGNKHCFRIGSNLSQSFLHFWRITSLSPSLLKLSERRKPHHFVNL